MLRDKIVGNIVKVGGGRKTADTDYWIAEVITVDEYIEHRGVAEYGFDPHGYGYVPCKWIKSDSNAAVSIGSFQSSAYLGPYLNGGRYGYCAECDNETYCAVDDYMCLDCRNLPS